MFDLSKIKASELKQNLERIEYISEDSMGFTCKPSSDVIAAAMSKYHAALRKYNDWYAENEKNIANMEKAKKSKVLTARVAALKAKAKKNEKAAAAYQKVKEELAKLGAE